MKKRILWAIFSLILTVAVTSFISFHLGKIVYAEQSGGSPESGVTSYIKTIYDDLVVLGFGSDADVPDWGAFWNRIKTAAKWVPGGNAAVGNVLTGTTFYNNSRTQQTGTMPDNEGDNASTAQSAAGGVNYFTAPTGYYDGSDRVSATNAQIAALAADLLVGNIKNGTSIFGVVGTYTGSGGLSETGQTTQYGTSQTCADGGTGSCDDGYYQKGLTHTFTDNGITVTDNFTGLVWPKAWNSAGANNGASFADWQAAITYCEGLNFNSQTDWRLPNRFEAESIFDYKRYYPTTYSIFTNVVLGNYWSSSTEPGWTIAAETFLTENGSISGTPKSSAGYYGVCVRSGS